MIGDECKNLFSKKNKNRVDKQIAAQESQRKFRDI